MVKTMAANNLSSSLLNLNVGHPMNRRSVAYKRMNNVYSIYCCNIFWTFSSLFCCEFGCEFHTTQILNPTIASAQFFHFISSCLLHNNSFHYSFFFFFFFVYTFVVSFFLFVSFLSFYFILRALNIYCIFKYGQNE